MTTTGGRRAQIEKATACVDRAYLVQQLMDLVNVPSQTGEELALATHLRGALSELGLRAWVQDVAPGRGNAVGVLDGRGRGQSLMFNGHLDVSLRGTEEGTGGIGYRTEARLVDDEWIYGMGAFNMKGALAAYLGAVHAIRRSGIRLAGDVMVAGVAGEIEKNPVGDARGAFYQGYGVGTRHLVTHGGLADMCVIGEPTGMRLVRTHLGSVWAQIEVDGELVHTAFARDGANAIVRMTRVIEAVRAWIPDYQRRHAVDGVAPRVNIGAVEGGWPWRASRTPARCRLFLDVRTPPDLDLRRVREELRDVVETVAQGEDGFPARVDLYATHPGTSVPADAPVVRELTAAHRDVTGVEPTVETANWYSDAATLNRYGVPSVNYGPGGRVRTGGVGWSQAEGEHQHVGDLVECTKVYVDLIMRVCGEPE